MSVKIESTMLVSMVCQRCAAEFGAPRCPPSVILSSCLEWQGGMKPRVSAWTISICPKVFVFSHLFEHVCERAPMVLCRFTYFDALHCHSVVHEELVPVKPVLSLYFFFF